ncbi:MAG TPA: rhodanese-like domain-containing protein [Dehalococcoidia bacterium]|nr:rhodanese-like domain-containing protein [Dehalococcoidia bacterium]
MPTKNPQEPFTRISIDEAEEILRGDNVALIDVREPHEYEEGHLPGAKLLPVNSVLQRADELPKDKDLVFVCAKGQRSALAAEMAAALGHTTQLYNIEGGTDAWREAGKPIEK